MGQTDPGDVGAQEYWTVLSNGPGWSNLFGMPAPKNANQELTTREREALVFYKKHLTKHGVPPSHRALAAALGVFPNAATWLIKRLTEKGYIEVQVRVRPITQRRLSPVKPRKE